MENLLIGAGVGFITGILFHAAFVAWVDRITALAKAKAAAIEASVKKI